METLSIGVATVLEKQLDSHEDTPKHVFGADYRLRLTD